MSTLKQRFALLAKERPEISQANLARATGAKPPSVNAWFSGDTKTMKADTAAKAAAVYGCNALWLATGAGPMWPGEAGPQATRPAAPAPHEAPADTPGAPPDLVITQFDAGGGMDTTGRVMLDDQPGIIRSWRVSSEWS